MQHLCCEISGHFGHLFFGKLYEYGCCGYAYCFDLILDVFYGFVCVDDFLVCREELCFNFFVVICCSFFFWFIE